MGPAVATISKEGFRSLLEANPWRGKESWDVWKGPHCMMAVVRDRWEEDDAFAGPARVTRAGPVAVVADASLYYRDELTTRLDPRYRSDDLPSPQDLLAAAYRTFHGDFVRRVDGDYAVAVWDSQHRRLTLARDPFGLRSLYYRVLPDLLVVASTPHPLIRCGPHPSLDREGILRDLLQQHGDGTRSGWEGVWELPASSRMEVSFDSSFLGTRPLKAGEKLETRRFWWPRGRQEFRDLGPDEAPEALAQLLIRASVARAVPSVTGISMSGGQDSTSVFASQKEGGVGEVPILSYRYPEGDPGDESEYVSLVAGEYETSVNWVATKNTDLFPILPDHVHQWSSPVGHVFEAINRAMAQEFRRLDLRILTSGHGGDHLFWVGLDTLAGLVRRGRVFRAYTVLRDRGWRGKRGLRAFRDLALRPALPFWVFDGLERVVGRRICSRPFEQHHDSYLGADEGLVSDILAQDRRYYDRSVRSAYRDTVTRIRVWPLFSSRFHRITAAHFDLTRSEGVEHRSPYLDRTLTEFSLSRPPDEFSRPGEHKALLGRAMEGRLPQEVRTPRSRSRKTGVTIGYFNERMNAGALPCLDRLIAEGPSVELASLGLINLDGMRRALEEMESQGQWSVSAYPALRAEHWVRARSKA